MISVFLVWSGRTNLLRRNKQTDRQEEDVGDETSDSDVADKLVFVLGIVADITKLVLCEILQTKPKQKGSKLRIEIYRIGYTKNQNFHRFTFNLHGLIIIMVKSFP